MEKSITGTHIKFPRHNASTGLSRLKYNCSEIIKENKRMTNMKFRPGSTFCWGFGGTGRVPRLKVGGGDSRVISFLTVTNTLE